jgi:hypothetical protein
MLQITYESELDSDYRKELDSCSSIQDLKNLIDKYKEISPDLKDVGIESDSDYDEFRKGFTLERSGQCAGDDWCTKFASLLIPAYILYASLLAEKYGAPWGVAYLRMCAEGFVPGVDPELAKQEIFSLLPG